LRLGTSLGAKPQAAFFKETVMRKWFYLTAAVLSVGLLSGLGYSVVQQGQEAPPEQKIAASRIVKVVAYPDSALVTREVDVPAGAGLTELVVSPLPVRVVTTSLYSEGSNGLRVLSTRFRTRQVFEDAREEVRKAEDEKYKLELAIEKLNADIKAMADNLKMLDKLENFTSVTTVSSTEKGGLNGDTVITMSKYVMEQRVKNTKELTALKHDVKEKEQKLEFVKRHLGELSSGTSREERDAVIVVDRDQNGGGKVRLNYLVGKVTWSPQYKLRAGKANDNVQIDYLATLVQQSGEDWNGVELTLSTAQPLLNSAPPDLKKLEISVLPRSSLPGGGEKGKAGGGGGFNPGYQPEDIAREAEKLRQQAQDASNSHKSKDAGKFLNEAAAWEQQGELMKTKEEIELFNRKQKGLAQPVGLEGPSVTYHLKHKLSVPSRNDEQVVEVAKLNLAPKYYYKAVPVLHQSVYRLADLVNKSEYVLLPGEATMYQGGDFVGRMHMPLVAVGEEFTAGFGVDPQLQIQRQMMDKVKSTQGGNQVMKFEYRILVNSYKTEKVQLQVWDRLPLAHETETTGVSLLKSAPELSKDALYLREQRPNNLLRWDLEVEPAMNGEKALIISYEFRLELDKQMVINVLQSK
jgi:hypothetical protein